MARYRRTPTRLLRDLEMHSIVSLEELAGVRKQLAVGGVIHSFDTGDLPGEGGVAVAEIGHQFGLRIPGSHYQDCASLRDLLCHALQVVMINGDMAAVARVGLVMQVLRWMCARHDGSFGLRGIEVKYFRFAMIDPHQGVIVIAHWTSESLLRDGVALSIVNLVSEIPRTFATLRPLNIRWAVRGNRCSVEVSAFLTCGLATSIRR